MCLDQMNIIQRALEITDCDHLKLAELAGFLPNEIKMVKLYWDSTFNKSWIYLSTEVIHDYFGYTKTKSSMSDFYKKIKENYKETINYLEVQKTHEIIKLYLTTQKEKFLDEKLFGNRTKFYIVTGETFKKMAMMANTIKGSETCDYFIKVESLCILMKDYLMAKMTKDHEIQLKNKENSIEEQNIKILEQEQINEDNQKLIAEKILENRNIHFAAQTKATYKKYENKIEALYEGGLENDLKDFLSKFGKTVNNKARTGNLGGASSDLNKFKMLKIYNTYEPLHIPAESFLHSLFKPFCINETRKEHFIIHPIFMDYIVVKFLNAIDEYTGDINEYIDLLEDNKYNYENVNEILKVKYNYNKNDWLNVVNNNEYHSYKKCRKCEIVKLSTEYDISPDTGDKLSYCKSCREDNQAVLMKQNGTKKCTKCMTTKKKSEFDTSPSTNKLYMSCKPCRALSQFKKCDKCLVVKPSSEYEKINGACFRYCNPCKILVEENIKNRTKKCNRCLIDKLLDKYPIVVKNSETRNHNHTCIDCVLALAESRAIIKQYICGKCDKPKIRSEYDISEKTGKYFARCRPCREK